MSDKVITWTNATEPPPLPPYLRCVVPQIGSTWEWEPLRSYNRCLLRVTDVTWDGEDCWVESELLCRNVVYKPAQAEKRVRNRLGRWVEATILIESRDA